MKTHNIVVCFTDQKKFKTAASCIGKRVTQAVSSQESYSNSVLLCYDQFNNCPDLSPEVIQKPPKLVLFKSCKCTDNQGEMSYVYIFRGHYDSHNVCPPIKEL